MTITKVAVLGTGAWGTTFAQVCADAGLNVTMWGRNASTVDAINHHENTAYLPNVRLSDAVRATIHLETAVAGAHLVAVVVPVAAVPSTLRRIKPVLDASAGVMCLAKGLEPGTHAMLHQVIDRELQIGAERIAVLSGPNLAGEIAAHQPSATVVASRSTQFATSVAKAIHNSYFRPYVSTDVIGCEIAGATKNVIAMTIGATEGLGLGANTRATLMTRGLAEMTRLGQAMGAQADTFAGLAGMGDLVATCYSKLSRNYLLGFRLGQGMSLEQALKASPGVVEGVRSAAPILELAHSVAVDMPITRAVQAVISGGATPQQMGDALLDRSLKLDGWRIELV